MHEPEAHPRDYKRRRRFERAGDARALNFACFRSQRFLASERTCLWLVSAIATALAKHDCSLLAYCFMPSHVHLLVFPRGPEPRVGEFLNSLKRSVSHRALAWVRVHAPDFLQRMRDEQPGGSVAHRFWQRGGGYDRNLFTAKAIWEMIDYIHRNPVEEGLCARPEDWRWSSAAFYATRTPGVLEVDWQRLPPRP